ncbi:putative nucleic acid-binding Zn ribbon protein [Sporosarcina luteola]|nr:putative nucleic acid-binding Zn ribbon protein [Sporosarcina luteola]
MRKKSAMVTEAENKKRQRISYTILIITIVFLLIASGFLTWNWFVVKDLYKAFVINFIGTSFLITAGVGLCLFFLYLFTVIVFKNPQRIKKSSIIKFAVGGIFTLFIAISLFLYGANEARKSMQDLKDYSNAEWQVKDMVVTDVYRGGGGSITLIETEVGDMVIHYERFLIQEGQTYRFTYLEATKTIIDVEQIRKL